MTREEAIEWIKSHHDTQMDCKDSEAMRMTIEALKAEPCEDVVSREAVLDEIYDSIKKCEKALASGIFNEKERFGIECEMKSLRYSLDVFENLPSVQPEIIRCRDCKFAHITNDRKYCKLCDMFTDDYGQLIEMYFDSNFYCGYAERRTDERID